MMTENGDFQEPESSNLWEGEADPSGAAKEFRLASAIDDGAREETFEEKLTSCAPFICHDVLCQDVGDGQEAFPCGKSIASHPFAHLGVCHYPGDDCLLCGLWDTAVVAELREVRLANVGMAHEIRNLEDVLEQGSSSGWDLVDSLVEFYGKVFDFAVEHPWAVVLGSMVVQVLTLATAFSLAGWVLGV